MIVVEHTQDQPDALLLGAVRYQRNNCKLEVCSKLKITQRYCLVTTMSCIVVWSNKTNGLYCTQIRQTNRCSTDIATHMPTI